MDHGGVPETGSNIEKTTFQKGLGKVLRFIGWTLLILLLLTLFTSFIVQIPAVQQWGVKQLSATFSKRYQTEVKIDRFRVNILKDLEMDHLLIRDLNGDTLLYSGIAALDFEAPLFSLFRNRLDVSSVKLKDARGFIHREKGRRYTNLQLVFNPALRGQVKSIGRGSGTYKKRSDDKKNMLELTAPLIELENCRFESIDEVKGTTGYYRVPYAKLGVRRLNTRGPQINLSSVSLINPEIRMTAAKFDTSFMRQLQSWTTGDSAQLVTFPEPFNLTADRFEIEGGSFSMINTRKGGRPDSTEDGVNFKDLELTGIEVQIRNLDICDWSFYGTPDIVSFKSSSGFVMDRIGASYAEVTPFNILLRDGVILTPNSTIFADLEFEYLDYKDFQQFEDEVIFDHQFDQSSLSINDLLAFVPKLKQSKFFENNANKTLLLDGRIYGPLNALHGRNVKLKLGNEVDMDLRFDTRNLTVKSQQVINARINNLSTTIPALKRIFPAFEPDPSVQNLRTLRFTGQFDGYLENFVAFGNLNTPLGSAKMDLQMDLTEGTGRATYSGQLDLIDFDLGEFTSNPDFGKINFTASISEGQGLSAESINAVTDASIQSFVFKNYVYENLSMDGRISSKAFIGDFSIADEHIDLAFNGQVNFDKDTPEFIVTGALNRLHLKPLNLSEEDLKLSAGFELDIRDIQLDRLFGEALLSDVTIVRGQEQLAQLEYINLTSAADSNENKSFHMTSSLIDANFYGRYLIIDLPKVMGNYLNRNHAIIADYFQIADKELSYSTDVVFGIKIKDTEGLTSLITTSLDTIRNASISGQINTLEEEYKIEVSIPEIGVNNNRFEQLFVLADGVGEYSNLVVSFDRAQLGKSIELNPFTLFMDVRQDTVDYTVNTARFESEQDNLNLEGKTFLIDDKWQIELLTSSIELFGEPWSVDPNNFLRIGKQFIRTRNFELTTEDRSIELISIDDKGLSADIQGLTMDELDELLNDDKYDFEGKIAVQAFVPDLFDIDALTGYVGVDSLSVNGDYYGPLDFEANMEELTSKIDVNLTLGDENKGVKAGGNIQLRNQRNQLERGEIDVHTEIINMPMKFLEYFIRQGINNTRGGLYGDLDITGYLDDPTLEGVARIEDGSTMIEILGTRYTLGSQNIEITSEFMDFTGVDIFDQLGNKGVINGGLTHYNLANFGLAVNIQSDNLLVLNTTREDGEVYYGYCIGDVDAQFSGSFDAPSINVDAESRPGTRLYILVEDEELEGNALDFIDFVIDTSETSFDKLGEKIRGVDFTLNLIANEDADVQIIFDELTRDIIAGNGRGDILLNYNRSGELSMYGEYEIAQGNYQFKNPFLGPVQISKPFEIIPGGIIQWAGDPFNANIDIEAKIAGLKAAPYNLIAEYLDGGSELEAEASQVTKVDLTLFLTGKLLQPNINFNIEFPVLSPRLNTLTDRKLAELAFDQNELNTQAAWLLGLGDFVPTDFTSYTQASVAVIANTVSEWLSNQISYYLSNIFERIFGNVGFVDEVEFDFGYVLSTGEYVKSGNFDLSRNEIRLGNKFNLFNRRLVLDVQGNIVNQSDFVQSGYFAPYVAMEYILTKDRRWRIRAYRDQDYGIDGERFRYGIGLSFRREYNSFDDFIKAVHKYERKLEKEREAEKVNQ